MADAYICDRCDEMFSGKPQDEIDLYNSKSGGPIIEEHIELCDECSDSFFKWKNGV